MKTIKTASLIIAIFLVGAGFASCSSNDNDIAISASAAATESVDAALDSIIVGLALDEDKYRDILRQCILTSSFGESLEESNSGSNSTTTTIDAEILESMLNIIFKCRQLDDDPEVFSDFDSFTVDSSCDNSEITAKVYALRIAGGADISAKAENIVGELLECFGYASVNRRVVMNLFPWFSWECVSGSRLYSELEEEQVRYFARMVPTNPREYVPSTRWDLSAEEADNALVECVDKKEFGEVLQLDVNSFQIDRDCTRRRLKNDPLEAPGGVSRQLLDYLNRVTARLPVCITR